MAHTNKNALTSPLTRRKIALLLDVPSYEAKNKYWANIESRKLISLINKCLQGSAFIAIRK